MTNKTALKRLKLDPYFSKTIETNLNVWSHDVNSFEIKFEFYNHECDKPIDLTGADMRILLDHADSQPKVYPLEIESKILGLAKFVMPKEIRGCEGKFTAHIYADYPNKTHDFGSFIFYTKLSRIDGEMGGCLDTVYVSEFEKALQDIKDKSTQFDNVEEELNKRIDVIEKDIASNEVAKQPEVTAIKKELKDLNFGCTNLLHRENISNFYYLAPQPGVVSDDKPHSYVVKVEEKKQYSFKRYDKDFSKDKGDRLRLIFFKNEPKANDTGLEIQGTIDGNIGEITGFEVPDGYNYLLLLLSISTHKIPKDNTFFKLVEGNRISDWSPSPKDMADKKDIGSLQKQIDELKNAITTLGGTL